MAGWRERKKQITRDGIVRAAMDLFLEHGYDATPVASIAEASMVSPATFFIYFPTKEDVVFADQRERTEAVAELLQSRGEDESLRQLVRRALDQVLQIGPVHGEDDALLHQRAQVVLASPTLRSAAARRLFESTHSWSDALIQSAPELSGTEARALLGSALGAAIAVAGYTVDRGETSIRAAMPVALDIALGETG